MQRFVVAGTQVPGQLMALCDGDGKFHVARAALGTPEVGARLMGNDPALGFGLLLGEPLDQVYRVTFEAVRCEHHEAMRSLRGAAAS
jgi:hypothetical protein